jgi:(R,R)-butanediol dehydrogenase/meso-butanediol dehydrogenase/diacetyl reductase
MTNKKMKAAVLTDYQHIEWIEVPVPVIHQDEALIKISYGGICGSDQHIFAGDFAPRTSPPLIQGHEFGGTIVNLGKEVKGFKEGDRVVADPIIPCGKCGACQLGHYPACTSLKLIGVDTNGGFAEYVKVKDYMLYKIPENIADHHSALVELYSIGFHACNRSRIKEGDSAVIWGGGRVGHVILQAARTKTEAPIFFVDILDKRLQIAQDSYSNVITINAKKSNPLEVITDFTHGRGVDIAFEAVGHGEHLEGVADPVLGCIRAIRGGGTVCVLGLSDESVPLVMKEIIWKEAQIVASRVSHGEFKDAIHFMDLGQLNPDVLISAQFPGNMAQKAFSILEKEPENYLKILLEF